MTHTPKLKHSCCETSLIRCSRQDWDMSLGISSRAFWKITDAESARIVASATFLSKRVRACSGGGSSSAPAAILLPP